MPCSLFSISADDSGTGVAARGDNEAWFNLPPQQTGMNQGFSARLPGRLDFQAHRQSAIGSGLIYLASLYTKIAWSW